MDDEAMVAIREDLEVTPRRVARLRGSHIAHLRERRSHARSAAPIVRIGMPHHSPIDVNPKTRCTRMHPMLTNYLIRLEKAADYWTAAFRGAEIVTYHTNSRHEALGEILARTMRKCELWEMRC